MIDWLTVILSVVHRPIYGGRVLVIEPDGTIRKDVGTFLSVEGSYSSNIVVRSHDGEPGMPVATQLLISGNPSKYFQGHNLFGSDDLPSLARTFVLDVLSRLGVELTAEERERIDSGAFRLTRVDLTGMSELPSREDVRAWIRGASTVMRGKYQSAKLHSSEQTLYLGQNSERVSLKVYCKGDELQAHPLHADMPCEQYDRLVEYADNKLRIEFTLRSKWLKRRELELVSSWGYNTAKDLYQERIQAVSLPENVPLSVNAPELEGLPARLVAVYKLWLQGEDLRQVYPKNTYYRYRRQLLEHGIDLNSPPRKPEASNVVPMWRYLVAEPAGVPDWALGTSLYFEPSKPKLKAL